MRMPVIFIGHGNPMIALEDSPLTDKLKQVGQKIQDIDGPVRGILSISAHWYKNANYVQSAAQPEQIYDMYGFPEALYELEYPVKGDQAITEAVQAALGDEVTVNDRWGVDHGSWTVLVHMFPAADIPVVQLSVNSQLSPRAAYNLGRKLASLRDQGLLIMGSGNIVHNLRQVKWDMTGGSPQTERFVSFINEAVEKGDIEALLDYESHPDAAYAVPTPDHFRPFVMALGAADGDPALAFNRENRMGALAMDSYLFSGSADQAGRYDL